MTPHFDEPGFCTRCHNASLTIRNGLCGACRRRPRIALVPMLMMVVPPRAHAAVDVPVSDLALVITAVLLGLGLGILATVGYHMRFHRERRALRQSHFGILTPAAIRYELSHQRRRRDVIAIDVRKLHDLNAVLGYDRANVLIAQWIAGCVRTTDTWGQYGGDEIVGMVPVGDGRGVLTRLIARAEQISTQIAPEQRAALVQRTGGLVDGFCIAACLIEDAAAPAVAAASALADVQRLKEAGPVTGVRSTSGAPGTLVAIQQTA